MLRFAPSPTGDMDISSLQIATLNYLVAQQKNRGFLVRIEDSDIKYISDGKDTEIMLILEKFALKHDTLYHQSEHLSIHQTLAIRLLKEKKAFICQCNNPTEEDRPCQGACKELDQEDFQKLKEQNTPFVIRVKGMEDFVILKSDGRPTPNFATACDDMLSSIELILHREDHRTIKREIYIKELLGYEIPTEYIELPQIPNAKEFSIKRLFEEGFIPDAILNYLILLSNPDAPQEIFTLPEAIGWFDLKALPKEQIPFEITKLRYINQKHLEKMEDKALSRLFGFADEDIGKLAKLYLQEATTITELDAKIRPIFRPKNFDQKEGEKMRVLEKIIANAPLFEEFDPFKQHILNESGFDEKDLIPPLRILLTGASHGPKLSEIYPFIKSYLLEVAS